MFYIVFVDEEKLKAAIAKKEVLDEDHQDLEMMIAKSVQKHDGLYQELTDI